MKNYCFSILLLLLSASVLSQETMRKAVSVPLVKKVGNYTFTSGYKPYFINDYYHFSDGGDQQWFYDFIDGNLVVHRVKQSGETVTEIRKWEIDLLRLDTNTVYQAYKSYGRNTGQKKYKDLGSIEFTAGEKFIYTEKGVEYAGEGKWVDMDFKNYSQFMDFWFEFRREWRKAAAELMHINVLKEMDRMDLKNYDRPYILNLLKDSTFNEFRLELPYIKRAKLVTEFRGQPLYNLLFIIKELTKKSDFVNEYSKYESNVNVWDSNGVSPLMLCVVNENDTALVSLLLKLGANPLAVNKEQKTAYDYARMLQKDKPHIESILRKAILKKDYLLETKLQFCTDYKLYSEGAQLLLAETQKYPDSLQLHFRRAAWNFNTKQYAPAVNAYNECIRLNKNEAKLYFNRALCYYALKMNGEANKDFEEAVRLKPFYKNEIETAKKQISEANQ